MKHDQHPLTARADRLVRALAPRPLWRMQPPAGLTGIEDRLSDQALMHMVDKRHLIGPFKPARPIVHGVVNQLRYLWSKRT